MPPRVPTRHAGEDPLARTRLRGPAGRTRFARTRVWAGPRSGGLPPTVPDTRWSLGGPVLAPSGCAASARRPSAPPGHGADPMGLSPPSSSQGPPPKKTGNASGGSPRPYPMDLRTIDCRCKFPGIRRGALEEWGESPLPAPRQSCLLDSDPLD